MNASIYDYDSSLIVDEKQYFILGCDENALKFAIRLLNAGLYFHGFLSLDKTLKGRSRLWNKPVISACECRDSKDIMIITPLINFYEDEKRLKTHLLEDRLIQLEIVNPFIANAPNVVIYGNGSQGKRIYENYSDLMKISCFCSSFEKYWGELFCNKFVISPQELSNLPEDTIIIIASNAYQKIYNVLLQYNIEDNRIYCSENDSLIIHSSCILEQLFPISKLMLVLQDSHNITLYGEEKTVEALSKKLELLDIYNVEKIGRKALEEDGSIFQLLYCDWCHRSLIITDDMNIKSIKLIEESGIPTHSIYWLKQCDRYYSYDYMKKSEFIPDPTLGYSVVELEGKEDTLFPGFVKYEYLDGSDKVCTILTLGGSTTQCFAVRETSWSELLSRILIEKKIPHRIFCGGVSGYSNIQEFLKLVRDGVVVQPDIVLSYSGVNNTNWLTDSEYPFIHLYQKEIFKRLKVGRNINVGEDAISLSELVSFGIPNSQQDSFQFWLLYERLMKSVCSELSIRFKAYLQPWLFSKRDFDEYDRKILLGLFQITAETVKDINEYLKDSNYKYQSDVEKAILFRKEIKKYLEVYSDWLVDLSHIMDSESGVYMDEAHVFEWGNQIIAEHIYESIKQNLEDVLREKESMRKE